MLLALLVLPLMTSAQNRRDLTVALVGFTSWSAVAWKLGRAHDGSDSVAALLALVSRRRHRQQQRQRPAAALPQRVQHPASTKNPTPVPFARWCCRLLRCSAYGRSPWG